MLLRIALSFMIGAVTLSAQTYLGKYSSLTNDGRTVTVHSDTSSVRICFYTEEIIRVDLLPTGRSSIDSSFVVIRQPENVPYTVNESDSVITISTSRMQVVFRKYPLRISVADGTGKVLLSEPLSAGYSFDQAARMIRFTMEEDDHFYGTGERGTSLDKRGQKFVSYNTQIGGYSDPLPTMNLNVPLVTTSSGYALYIDNTYRGEFDFGVTDPSGFSYSAEGGEISYYVIAASDIPKQLERYTWLTGRQPLPPRWIFGFTQSKNRYVNEEEARGIVRTMREKNFPCDAIVLDLAWFRHMGDISWDTAAWPNRETMITDFLSMGVKTLLITEPYIIQPSHNFAEADRNGFLAKDSTGKTLLLEKWWSCGGCNSSLIDLTNPDAQKWWWNKHPAAFGKNVAGIWTDLGEPEKHPESMQHYLGSTVKVHNIFNLLWAKMVFDGFTSLKPNDRVVNLTRSGFAGIQRYGILPWSGDVARSFGGLAVQLPMVLNMGMSGIAYHNSDIGGYARNPTTPELYVRWMQYGVFCPVTRTHGAGEVVNGSATEPWGFGAEAEAISREYLQLRYRLLPYIYSLAFQNYSTGMPLARPLFWMDAADTALTNESSSYMFGDALLVSPVVATGKTTKELYLPKGNWTDLWTGKKLAGGKRIVAQAPLKTMPVYVKAGSIIPMGPLMSFSDERPLDTLTLLVFPDRSIPSSSFVLYEDDGKSKEYEQGMYLTTEITQSYSGKDLSVLLTSSKGSFAGMPAQRTTLLEVHHIAKKPGKVLVNGHSCVEMRSVSSVRGKSNAYFYDARRSLLHVTVPTRLDGSYDIRVPGVALR